MQEGVDVMKGDNPTAAEIRDVIDWLREGRVFTAEHSDFTSEQLDASEALLLPILRYALRCRVAEDKSAAGDDIPVRRPPLEWWG
jgi:hypothetical protein